MANANRPWGLKPVGYRGGSPWNGKAHTYYIPSSDTNAYAVGDPVTFAGSGSAGGVADVVLATAGTDNPVLGAIVGTRGVTYGGVLADPASLDTTIIPATKTKGYYVLVADDPDLEFLIQEDGVGGTIAVTGLGNNYNLVSGSNNGYVSGWMLDSSSVAITATLQLQLLRLWQAPDNELGSYAKWVVRINRHAWSAGIAGV